MSDLVCPYCECSVEVVRDPDSASYLDVRCIGCGAAWDGRDGALLWSNVAPLPEVT